MRCAFKKFLDPGSQFFFILLGMLALTFQLGAQFPHGDELNMNCAACHTSESWDIPSDFWSFEESDKFLAPVETRESTISDTTRFNHFNTVFPLRGQHALIDCRSCHETLVFSEAQEACISCHTDMHNQTVGTDCARCHTFDHWLVDNITELHQDNGFPLLGVHASVSCNECHISDSELQFNRIGNDCINCHFDDYLATTDPNHQVSGFSTDCTDCHTIDGSDWSSENINHDFFPLTQGHNIPDCTECHTSGDFTISISNECVSCHQADYDNAQNPNHQTSNFPTDCKLCHTTDVGWAPADFSQHDDEAFPIYRGKHKGEWSMCSECHTTEGNYTLFSCIDCHEHNDQGDLDDKHDEVSGYEYSSAACYSCHPNGEE